MRGKQSEGGNLHFLSTFENDKVLSLRNISNTHAQEFFGAIYRQKVVETPYQIKNAKRLAHR